LTAAERKHSARREGKAKEESGDDESDEEDDDGDSDGEEEMEDAVQELEGAIHKHVATLEDVIARVEEVSAQQQPGVSDKSRAYPGRVRKSTTNYGFVNPDDILETAAPDAVEDDEEGG